MITFFLQMRRTLRVLWSIFKDDETRGIAGVTAVLLLSGTLFLCKCRTFYLFGCPLFFIYNFNNDWLRGYLSRYSRGKNFYHDVFSCRIRGYGEFSSCCG